MMKKLFVLLALSAALAADAKTIFLGYKTEATLTPMKKQEQLLLEVKISKVEEVDGQNRETIVSQTQLLTKLGPQEGSVLRAGDEKGLMIIAELVWPEAGKGDFATCSVKLEEKGKFLSLSRFQLKVDGEKIALSSAPARINTLALW
jgi:hypothetical protein